MSDEERRAATTGDRTWATGYAAGRAAERRAAPSPALTREALQAAEEVFTASDALPETMRATLERNGIIFDKWPVAKRESGPWTPEELAALDPEVRWQGVAFTLYTDWVIGPLHQAIEELREELSRVPPPSSTREETP